MNFPYMKVSTSMDSLEVEDIGNCNIRAFNDMGEEFILVIDTQLGTSRIFQYGPLNTDICLFPQKVNCSFQRIEFSQGKISKIINTFLNSGFPYKITQAELVTKEEALKDCRSIIEYMKQEYLY